ncbi:cAMP-binding domain of CRP or a regulatory subunit of cAMP-dependent protein kinases [Pedobacter westerhofensis]|uniref:cAMP-binding domain of CRP or a regulatory subunit of cAMP-dependent protein kinases n=1 Tax=Pedobacter westerhofensis TaxID=425512 RepID=A0A521FRR0_9SPHI|nr:Crp/Fnr family transcriptional regulator [Pedobacter westerhofensis]SMO98888.1 cAMP-binding domain of CRP or a regulatory subunit of cAMP-dependent protein kinases [Pedobacter westerhofensis]
MENEELFKLLAGKYPLRPELKEKLNEMIKREYYAKSQVILKPGQISNRAWFIEKGAAMGVIFREEKKVPFWFWNEGQLMISLNSFFNQVPSETYIELLEPSVLLSISYEHVSEITRLYPESNEYIRKVMHEYQKMSEKRILEFAAYSPEEHYLHLMKDCPAIFRKASVESIAAYLGISRKTLNRIRNRTRRM